MDGYIRQGGFSVAYMWSRSVGAREIWIVASRIAALIEAAETFDRDLFRLTCRYASCKKSVVLFYYIVASPSSSPLR